MNRPFTIAAVSPTLDEFKNLSVEDQGIIFLGRLAHLFRRGQTLNGATSRRQLTVRPMRIRFALAGHERIGRRGFVIFSELHGGR